jgi:hypothetical protein
MEFGGKNELEARLQLGRRQIDRLEALGVLIAGSDERFDLALNERRYRAFMGRDADYVARQIDKAVEDFQAGMAELAAEPDLHKRRKLAETLKAGSAIGQLDAAMRLGNAISSEAQRPLLGIVTRGEIARLLATYLDLLEFEYAEDSADRRKPGRKPRRRVA